MPEIKFPNIEEILAKKGICDYGDVQMAVDEAVIEFCLDYAPWDTGELANSPYMHDIGIGKITYSATGENGYNYASHQYYLHGIDEVPTGNYHNQNGRRGSWWAERMAIDRIHDIERRAKEAIK